MCTRARSIVNCCIVLGISIVLVGCHSKSQLLRKRLYFEKSNYTPTKDVEKDLWITVWVHGARPFGNDTERYGLCRADQFESGCDLERIARKLMAADKDMFNAEHFYMYSWPGDLDFDKRDAAGKDLYEQIVLLVEQYKDIYHVTPKIRIIAHSHGGNVVLSMAKNRGCCFDVAIDELVLLAVPVQVRTMDYVKSPLFKRIFALYSTFDIGQVIDPQGLYDDGGSSGLFSNFRFQSQGNLLQAHTLLNGYACFHGHFHFHLLPLLPSVIQELKKWADQLPTCILADPKYHYTLALYNDGRAMPHYIPAKMRYEYVQVAM